MLVNSTNQSRNAAFYFPQFLVVLSCREDKIRAMTKDDLAQFIGNSDLSHEDKQMWQDVLASLEGEYLDSLAEFVDNNPDNLIFITQNILKKKSAFASKDNAAIVEVLKEEKQFLSQE